MMRLPCAADILHAVEAELWVPVEDMRKTNNTADVAAARQAYSVACRMFTHMSFPEIARACGRPHHSGFVQCFHKPITPATFRVVKRLEGLGFTRLRTPEHWGGAA